MSQQSVTAMASAIDLTNAWSSTNKEVGRRFHAIYGPGLERAPHGNLISRGLPFQLADEGSERRWLFIDQARRVDLGGIEATHLILLHFCDAWREESGDRPIGVPPGWVLPVGEPLARIRIGLEDDEEVDVTLRRRFEVNEGVIGWGAMAYLAVPHLAESPVDWRGPHAKLPDGRFAEPGHTGPMAVLPSSWATNQTGVEDHVPSPNDDLTLWLHAIEISRDDRPKRLRSIDLEPIDGSGDGRSVVVAAMTAYTGSSSPLRWKPRRSIRVEGAEGVPLDVDLGLVARRRPIPGRTGSDLIGWGATAAEATSAEELEFTAADDAALAAGNHSLPVGDISPAGAPIGGSGVRVSSMAAIDRRLHVKITDSDGQSTPSRVRFVARDGRYLPPLGHRAEVNLGLNEDSGADIVVGGAEYAYVEGEFDIDVTADGANVEVVSGFDRTPLRVGISPDDIDRGSIELAFGQDLPAGAGRWIAGDTHVHFLAPSTALLQARAEGVNVVHLLATQWGDDHTSLTDFGGDLVHPGGEHAVWVGSENRQNILGHIGLVGSSRPVLPFASGGPPEGPIGGPVTLLMADWLRRSREQGGLAIGAHFPLPMAEVAADIGWGLFDALEFETFDLTLENPPIRGWYRYLNAGYRLPVVGGTDKMTASVPLGQIRTWARLDDDAPLTFGSWAAAVRDGRTFVSSGPLLELRVEGAGPGVTIDVDSGTSLEIELVARAAQPMISDVELILDGDVVASRTSSEPTTELALRERVRIERTGWLAGRCRSPFAIGSAFATAMAAHTSPLYLECPDRPRRPVDLTEPLAVIDGTRAWLEQLAPIRDPADLERFVRFLDEGERRLREHHE